MWFVDSCIRLQPELEQVRNEIQDLPVWNRKDDENMMKSSQVNILRDAKPYHIYLLWSVIEVPNTTQHMHISMGITEINKYCFDCALNDIFCQIPTKMWSQGMSEIQVPDLISAFIVLHCKGQASNRAGELTWARSTERQKEGWQKWLTSHLFAHLVKRVHFYFIFNSECHRRDIQHLTLDPAVTILTNTSIIDSKATYRESSPKGARMSDPGRSSEGQSGETDSQNKTPEHHLWNSQRKHDASPGPKLPQSGEAAGQGHRAQRPSPRHCADRHEYNIWNTAKLEISAEYRTPQGSVASISTI